MGGMTFVCCSREKDDNKEEIKPNEEKPPVTSYKYSYAYATTPYVVQQPMAEGPLYHESMSQAPMYSVSRAPTVINH